MKKLLGLLCNPLLAGTLLGALAVAALLFANLKTCQAAGVAPDRESEALDDSGTALTIYNQNFFVAREHVPLDLKPGVNEAQYAGVAAHLEPDSVIL
ncbi:MAG TPA: hypothetical protein VFB00_01600, partial [Terriglobales bacterium]|nr:hypothetical protein [Terriglobales bacterium]